MAVRKSAGRKPLPQEEPARGGEDLVPVAQRQAGREPAARDRQLDEVRELARLLDNAFRIPLVNYRFGVDAILGLVPVVGDFSAMALSGWIIYRAARMGAPKRLLARMLVNALGDTVVGSVPVLGTIVDVVWKANARNLKLLERHLERDRP